MQKRKSTPEVTEGLPVRETTTGSANLNSSANEDVKGWLRLAHDLEGLAFETTDVPTLKLVHQFLSGLVQVKQLLDTFAKAKGQLDGEGGVAKLLGISRNAVYLRMDWVGLKAEDFRKPEVTLASLVVRSKPLHELLLAMKEKSA